MFREGDLFGLNLVWRAATGVVLTGVLLILAACATGTPYRYEDKNVTEILILPRTTDGIRRLRVEAHGNGVTSEEKVRLFALRRAAEVASELGEPYLAVTQRWSSETQDSLGIVSARTITYDIAFGLAAEPMAMMIRGERQYFVTSDLLQETADRLAAMDQGST